MRGVLLGGVSFWGNETFVEFFNPNHARGSNVKLSLDLDLPGPLFDELERAAFECRIPVSFFAAEAIESVLASRRLPNVAESRCGARLSTVDEEAA